MIELRKSKIEEVDRFVEMEKANDTPRFIIPYSVEKHLTEIENDQIIYLSIYSDLSLVGFIILAVEDENSIEFRRIVVATKGKGVGQLALQAMENYCANDLKCKRIWLDVFEENARGIYIYKKFGYKHFKTSTYNHKPLLFMEKSL